MTTTDYKIRGHIVAAILVVAVFVFPKNLYGAELPAPLPTYEKVADLPDSTKVTVEPNQMMAWRGSYTLSFNPLIIRRGVSLEKYLEAHLNLKISSAPQKRTFKYNPYAIYAWTGQIANQINTKAVEPEMVIENGRVTKFTPPKIGKSLDRYNSTIAIIEQLQKGNTEINLVVKSTRPDTQLSDLNNLGIAELIGRGESKFSGSPANRRHNIRIGTSKMSGIIVNPGETFSFNKYLGPVEASTGFLPELVIRADKGTVPEFGGGLCQVSSTVFRAAMHAGLPIKERRNHSYAVQYYAPQGTDATIYPGVVDLKFTNDTANSILVWPYFKDNDYLVFDLYGTYDNRKVVLEKPTQFNKKPDGSMKALWERKVVMSDGQEREDKFPSDYKPPALFHKENKFVPTPPTIPEQATHNESGTPIINETVKPTENGAT